MAALSAPRADSGHRFLLLLTARNPASNDSERLDNGQGRLGGSAQLSALQAGPSCFGLELILALVLALRT